MLLYDDLFNVPFKPKGRDKNGMDCFGLVLECCKRLNLPLIDVVYETTAVSEERLNNYEKWLNVKEIEIPHENCIIQWLNEKNTLHVGFMVDRKNVLHATRKGVQLTPLKLISDYRVYECNSL